MTYSLICPECSLHFDYDVITVPGNTGSQELVQISLSVQNNQGVEDTSAQDFVQFFIKEQSSLSIGFKENTDWNLQEIWNKDNAVVNPEGVQLNYGLVNQLRTVRDIFYLTCPNGHRRRYTIDINRD